MTPAWTVLKVNSWGEAKETLSKRTEGGWAFRGQRCASWPLATSLERTRSLVDRRAAERVLLDKFQRRAHQYVPRTPALEDTPSWLALIQHHGAPTRLLDWTKSPYVASYFALEDALDEECKCAVWAINFMWCRTQAVKTVWRQFPQYSNLPVTARFDNAQLFNDIFLSETMPASFVAPIDPYLMNERLIIQQGIFLCPGDATKCFVENLRADSSPRDVRVNVQKLEIPNRVREDALKDLSLMNINRATLFPGADGLAQSLKVGMSIFSTLEPY